MTPWRAAAPNIFADDSLGLFRDRKFTIVDAGAAGDMFQPFDATPEQISVYTFEPRGAEFIAPRPHEHHCVPGGIWSHAETQTLHIAEVPETSSIYPPDEALLRRFIARYGYPPRRTVRTAQVQMISVDEAVAAGQCALPNFIKLDVHSAEYEALLGARNSVSDCLGVLVETWDLPIHRGQHRTGEVETLLNRLGFELFARRPQCTWRHEHQGEVYLSDRPQQVGAEALFLKSDAPDALASWHVALLELFGYGAFARSKLDEYAARGAVPDHAALAEALARNAAHREAEEQARLRSERLRRKKLAE